MVKLRTPVGCGCTSDRQASVLIQATLLKSTIALISGFGRAEYYNTSYIVIIRIYDDESRLRWNNIVIICIGIHVVSNDNVTDIRVSVVRLTKN